MTWNKEKSWSNRSAPSTESDPGMNELGRTDASYQPASYDVTETAAMQAPMVLVDHEYVEAPIAGDPREVFGVEASFDEGGVRVEKTLEEDNQERQERQQQLVRRRALQDAHIHPPVDWGPDRGAIARADNSVIPDDLTYSA